MIEHLDTLWNQLIDVASKLVIPDWGALVGLLPVFLVIGMLGPILTVGLLAWLSYAIRRPRAKVRLDEGPRLVPLHASGRPVAPVGEPYCLRDDLIYPSGTTRCTACGDDLAVRCPMCGLGRSAHVETCGNCGLVLRIETRARVARPAGPPPGGAAVA